MPHAREPQQQLMMYRMHPTLQPMHMGSCQLVSRSVCQYRSEVQVGITALITRHKDTAMQKN
jgi:hypothetical protein